MPETMRAVIATGYGAPDVLDVRSLPVPTPGEGEILVRVRAAAVTAADTMMRRGTPAYARLFLGLRRPRRATPGTGFAGVVEAIGPGVTRFAAGDAVFGETATAFGAHGERLCLAEDGVVLPKPEGLPFDEAAVLCDGAVTSLNFLRRVGALRPGERLLVNGAAGSLGSAGVQIGRALGADVTAVAGPDNQGFVRDLGAGRAIDYTRQDFAAEGGRYDVVYDAVGKAGYRRARRALRPGGRYLSPVLGFGLLASVVASRWFGRTRAHFDATGLRPAGELRAHLEAARDLVLAGKLRALVTKRYTVDEIREAHAHIDTGHKRGNVVLQMGA